MGDGLLHLVVAEDPGNPKVGNLGLVLVIQQYVVKFDVTVDDLGVATVVQVLQPPGNGYPGPSTPVPVRPLRLQRRPEEEGAEGASRHELEHQHPVRPLLAVPDHPDQVLVVHPTDRLHLILELRLHIFIRALEFLHRNVWWLQGLDDAMVDLAEATLAQQLAEAIGRSVQLLSTEHSRVHMVSFPRISPLLGDVAVHEKDASGSQQKH